MAGDADDVLIDGGRLRNPLPFERAFNLENPVPQPGRFLEVFAGRGGIHLRAQVVHELPVVPFEKLSHLPDDAVVILLRLLSCAGGHAALDFELDARAFGRPVDVDRACGQWKHLLDDFQRFPEGAGWRVGAIVQGAVLLDAAHDGEPGKAVFDRQAKIRILLVVSEHDIEARAVSFDEVALENQGFQFRPRDHRLEVRDVTDEQGGFGSMVGALEEVGSHAVGEPGRLADIQHVTGPILKEVHTGLIWKVSKF